MWIKRKDVVDYANKYLKDVTIEDILVSIRSFKIEISKQEIISWMSSKDDENVEGSDLNFQLLEPENDVGNSLNSDDDFSSFEKDYDTYAKNLKVYRGKCNSLCNILKFLADIRFDLAEYVQMFDFTIEEDKILESDVLRVLKPLMVNFALGKALKVIANDYESYTGDICTLEMQKFKKRANSTLVNVGFKTNDEAIEGTAKQKRARLEEYKNACLRKSSQI